MFECGRRGTVRYRERHAGPLIIELDHGVLCSFVLLLLAGRPDECACVVNFGYYLSAPTEATGDKFTCVRGVRSPLFGMQRRLVACYGFCCWHGLRVHLRMVWDGVGE